LGRYPGLKTFLNEGHSQKYEKLEAVRGATPPALRFYDEAGLEVEFFEIRASHTKEDIHAALSSRGIHSSDEIKQAPPDTSCGGR